MVFIKGSSAQTFLLSLLTKTVVSLLTVPRLRVSQRLTLLIATEIAFWALGQPGIQSLV